MQPFAILVVLMMMQQPDFGTSVQKFLQFYRENRALIAAIAGDTAADDTSPPPADEKSSRPEGGGAEKNIFEKNILEEYLKNACVR